MIRLLYTPMQAIAGGWGHFRLVALNVNEAVELSTANVQNEFAPQNWVPPPVL